MAHMESKVDMQEYLGTEYSSGDCNKVKSKQREENNNEIDELSKDLSEMGCIVDAVKRPPNICIETCVYESEDDDSQRVEGVEGNEEDEYSEEFEEDKSEADEDTVQTEIRSDKSYDLNRTLSKSDVKMSKSQSSISSTKPPISLSGRSSHYGSLPVPQTRRINMSFPNDRLREIERHNHILLNKILTARNVRKSSIPTQSAPKRPVPSAAVHRKRQQRQIDHENMILLKKIQGAKSSSYSIRR